MQSNNSPPPHPPNPNPNHSDTPMISINDHDTHTDDNENFIHDDEIYTNGYMSPDEEIQSSQERLQQQQQPEYNDHKLIEDDTDTDSPEEEESKQHQEEEVDDDEEDDDTDSERLVEEERIMRDEPLQQLPTSDSICTIIYPAHPHDEDRVSDHFMEIYNKSGENNSVEIHRRYQHKIVTQQQYQKGRDIQGIDWATFPFTRSSYRHTRHEQYQRFTNLSPPSMDILTSSAPVKYVNHLYYQFYMMEQRIKPQFQHFQLRHLCWTPASHSVFTMSHHSLRYYNTHTHHHTRVMTFDDNTMICSMAVADGLMYAGGIQGQLFCQNMSNGLFLTTPTKLTESENAICNAITPYHTSIHSPRVLVANNDAFARNFDLPTFKAVIDYRAEWPVNHCSGSPLGDLVILAGDNPNCLLLDAHTGQHVASLNGHKDFTFSTSWHPDGIHVATANQDCTTRVWDVRHTRFAITTLVGEMCAIRSCQFSHDGSILAMSEAADFVHIYGVNDHMYDEKQTCDFFGEIAGISFTPTDESLFIAVSDRRYGGIMEWQRTPQHVIDMTIL